MRIAAALPAACLLACACACVSPARAQPSATSAASMSAPAASATGGATTYVFDPAHTGAMFEVQHFWTSTLRGTVGPIAGTVTIDRAAGTGDMRLRIPMTTLATGVPVLDARLKKPDLLAVGDYPEAYFLSSGFEFDAAGGVRAVHGELFLRGAKRPLTLVARRFACRRDERFRREVCGGDFTGDLKRSDFGAGFGEPFVGDDVHLVVQVEAIAQ